MSCFDGATCGTLIADTILYPLSERVLPGEVRGRMLQAYSEAESKTPGLEEGYRKVVEKYERQRTE